MRSGADVAPGRYLADGRRASSASGADATGPIQVRAPRTPIGTAAGAAARVPSVRFPRMERPIRILFVCLGNICRSPLAEGLFRHHVEMAGLSSHFEIDSAGTGGWHVGEPPDKRMCAVALARGLDIRHLRARQIRPDDLHRHNLVLAMDKENLRSLRRLAGQADTSHVRLFRSFDPKPGTGEVPDPYYGGEDGFIEVFEIVDRTSRALLEHVRREYRL